MKFCKGPCPASLSVPVGWQTHRTIESLGWLLFETVSGHICGHPTYLIHLSGENSDELGYLEHLYH